MRLHDSLRSRNAFTLIELLVVIAIIAILAVVVVLTLNPAELLRQARDSNRLSDLATINSAVNLYMTDQSGAASFSLGNASSVYLSLPDTSTSCANLGLATTSPSGIAYGCASSTSSRNINSSGWIPVNFSNISAGSPLSALPVDPTNQSSSGLYYTYYGSGTQFETTALFESQKYKTLFGQNPVIPNLPEVNAIGTSLAINPLFNPSGLAGYLPMEEGTGTVIHDYSGSNAMGNWAGATGSQWAAGKIGTEALRFDGTTNLISLGTYSSITPSAVTITAWVSPSGGNSHSGIVNTGNILFSVAATGIYFWPDTSNYMASINQTLAGWTFVAATYDYNSEAGFLFINGSTTAIGNAAPAKKAWASTITVGLYSATPYYTGLLDDVRIYNRALSAAEIQALYNAEK